MYPQNRNQIAYLFNEWGFGRICNPPELSISIFNALFRIKNGFDFGRRPLVPDIYWVHISKLK